MNAISSTVAALPPKSSTVITSLLTIVLVTAPPVSGQGLIFLSPEVYDSLPVASAPQRKAPLPRSVDLSEYLPPPGDQGNQASCVGWAVAYGLKTYQESVEFRRRPTRPEHTFSPAFVYNAIAHGGCQGGSDIWEALNLMANQGVAPFPAFPYDDRTCYRMPDQRTIEMARDYRISSARTVDTRQEAVKSQLANGFPVVIGMHVGDEFRNHGSGVFHGDMSIRGGHAMLVVGYDDGLGAYKVLNSWGPRWGEQGYGWISYRTFARQVAEAYVAQDASSPRINNTTNNPSPTRRPTRRASAVLQVPIVIHDYPVQSTAGVSPGMSIRVPGEIRDAAGRSAQIVVRFAFQRDGTPLPANPQEYVFRDNMGGVATGTSVFSVPSETMQLGATPMFIPYYALNLRPTNYRMQYDIIAWATVYLNDFAVAESNPVPMFIRW